MEFTIVDGGVAAILLISGILAWSRGFTREALAIIGWIAAAVAAVYFAPMVEPLLREVPYVGPFLEKSCSLSKLAAVLAVFVVALIIISIFTPLFSSVVRDSPLGFLDKALGFAFGVVRGLLLVLVVYLLYDMIAAKENRYAEITNSWFVQNFSDDVETLKANAPDTMPEWLVQPLDALLKDCGGLPGVGPDGELTPQNETPQDDATQTGNDA